MLITIKFFVFPIFCIESILLNQNGYHMKKLYFLEYKLIAS